MQLNRVKKNTYNTFLAKNSNVTTKKGEAETRN
jgi:hypothetical protein